MRYRSRRCEVEKVRANEDGCEEKTFSHRNRKGYGLGAWVRRRHRGRWQSFSWRVRCMWRHHGWHPQGRSSEHHESLRRSWLRYAWHHWMLLVASRTGRGVNAYPRRARRRMAGFVIPWMLSRRILRCLLAPPFPRPLPPFPPVRRVSEVHEDILIAIRLRSIATARRQQPWRDATTQPEDYGLKCRSSADGCCWSRRLLAQGEVRSSTSTKMRPRQRRRPQSR